MSFLRSKSLVRALVYPHRHKELSLGWLIPSKRNVVITLAAVGLAVLGVGLLLKLSGNGDIVVLKQRLNGQVKLSNGTYSARTLGELNQASWTNGLQVLETLDNLNDCVSRLQQLENMPNTQPQVLAQAQQNLDKYQRQLDALLKDRETLTQAAQVFKTNTLYAPVFQEYLDETKAKLNALKLAQTSTGQAL